MSGSRSTVDEVGLCRSCVHARRVVTSRRATFWRCGRHDGDETFPKYPPLPVRACPGYEGADDAGEGSGS